MMGDLTDCSIEEIDMKVQCFIVDTNFEANEIPEGETHLNG
jgi:hypothetical protein